MREWVAGVTRYPITDEKLRMLAALVNDVRLLSLYERTNESRTVAYLEIALNLGVALFTPSSRERDRARNDLRSLSDRVAASFPEDAVLWSASGDEPVLMTPTEKLLFLLRALLLCHREFFREVPVEMTSAVASILKGEEVPAATVEVIARGIPASL